MPKHKQHNPSTTSSASTLLTQSHTTNKQTVATTPRGSATTTPTPNTVSTTNSSKVKNTIGQQQQQLEQQNNSRNIHEELRNELFAEAMVFPDSISFYYVNEPVKKPTPQLSYVDAVNKSNTTTTKEQPTEKKIPRLEEFTIEDPDKIDCTRKIQIIYICTVNYTDENSPMLYQQHDHFSEEIKKPENKQSSVKLIMTLPVGYPVLLPEVSIENLSSISKDAINYVYQKIMKKCEEGRGFQLLHDIITTCTDSLKEYADRLEESYLKEVNRLKEERERRQQLDKQREQEIIDMGAKRKKMIKEEQSRKYEQRMKYLVENSPTPLTKVTEDIFNSVSGTKEMATKSSYFVQEEEQSEEDEEEDQDYFDNGNEVEEDEDDGEEEEEDEEEDEDDEEDEDEKPSKSKFFTRSGLVDDTDSDTQGSEDEDEEEEEEIICDTEEEEESSTRSKKKVNKKNLTKSSSSSSPINISSAYHDNSSSSNNSSPSLGVASSSPSKNFMNYFLNAKKKKQEEDEIEESTSSNSRTQILLIHMVKMFCNRLSKNQQGAFTELSDQLTKIGVLGSDMKKYIDNFGDLKDQFKLLFNEQIKSASENPTEPFSFFWKEPTDQVDSSSNNASRYKTDFEELEKLGEGGFGSVTKCKNMLDQRIYAIKKIRFHTRDEKEEKIILREVNLLSRLNHSYIVRYFNAWREENNETIDSESDFSSTPEDSEAFFDYSFSSSTHSELLKTTKTYSEMKSANTFNKNMTTRILYIQMEYCQEILTNLINNAELSKEEAWRYFRQTVEALDYLHKNDIIHRDLKPSNLFISVDKTIKVGDFGLSVAVRGKSYQQSRQLNKGGLSEHSFSLTNSSDLSTGVGTIMYSAPEVLTSPHYTSKVDIYSLGIIFFEMLHPRFTTGSERLAVLSKLRECGKVPNTFPVIYEKEKEIIEWMLNSDPERRPTAEQLLSSEYMPLSTTEEKLTILFNRKEKDFSMSTTFNLSRVYAREKAVLRLQSVFQLHAAVEFDVEAYFPNSDQIESVLEKKNLCPVMFESGKLMNIARDGSISLARYLARLPKDGHIKFLKRYSFLTIAKPSTKEGMGIETRQICSVDIVGSRFGMITDAEVIKIMSRVVSFFTPNSGYWVLRINHSGIIYSILDYCDIPKSERDYVCAFASKLKKHNYSWDREKFILDRGKPIIKDLFRLHEAVDVTRQKLANIFTNIGAREALNDISTLLDNFKIWGINKSNFKVEFDTSLTNNYQRYSGLIFQFGIQKGNMYTPIINGGRYDKLVSNFTLFDKMAHNVVGANIKLDKLFKYTTLVEHPPKLENQVPEEDQLESPAIPPFDSGVPQVLVYSENRDIKEERMKVADLLWEAGIRADLTYDDNCDYDFVKNYCIQHKVKYIVVTKSNLISKNLVRIRLSDQKGENGVKKAKVYEIDKRTLVQYITSDGKVKKPTMPTSSSTGNLQTISSSSSDGMPSGTPSSHHHHNHHHESKLDVKFLQPKNKSKHQSTASIALKKCNQLINSMVEDSVLLVSLSMTAQEVKEVTSKISIRGNPESELLSRFLKEHDGKTNVFIYTSKDDKISILFFKK